MKEGVEKNQEKVVISYKKRMEIPSVDVKSSNFSTVKTSCVWNHSLTEISAFGILRVDDKQLICCLYSMFQVLFIADEVQTGLGRTGRCVSVLLRYFCKSTALQSV